MVIAGEFEEAGAEGLQGREQREEYYGGSWGLSCSALGQREEFGFSSSFCLIF